MISEDYFLEKSNRLISQYHNAELVKAIQNVILEELYILKDLIASLPEIQSIEKSTGALLDLAGSVYAVSRRPRDSDETYRAIILANIAARKSNGKISDIKNVINLLLGNVKSEVFTYSFNTIKIEIESEIPENLKSILLDLLSISVSSGKKIAILLETAPQNFRFGLTWGNSFAKPIKSRFFDRILRFLVPASQSNGVFVLVDSSGTWSISASGTVEPWPGSTPPNGPLGVVPEIKSDEYIDINSSLGRLIIRLDRTQIIPFTNGLRIDVKKGQALEFFVNDSFYSDNRGAFEIEIGVKNG